MMKLLKKLEIPHKFNTLLILFAVLLLFDEIAFVKSFVDTTEFESSAFDSSKEWKPEVLEDYAYNPNGNGQFSFDEVSYHRKKYWISHLMLTISKFWKIFSSLAI